MRENIINKDNFTITDTEKETVLKSKKPDKDGFSFTISFTKDEKENEEAMQAIKEFFVREVNK